MSNNNNSNDLDLIFCHTFSEYKSKIRLILVVFGKGIIFFGNTCFILMEENMWQITTSGLNPTMVASQTFESIIQQILFNLQPELLAPNVTIFSKHFLKENSDQRQVWGPNLSATKPTFSPAIKNWS
jgi:hypothetical protein